MKTTFKLLLIVLIAVYFSACVSNEVKPESSLVWDTDSFNKFSYDKFMDEFNECKDFAFKSVVRGAPFHETDIHTECLKRKGYKTKWISKVTNQN